MSSEPANQTPPVSPTTRVQAVAVPGIPTVTSGDDLAAVISPHLNVLQWPDGYVGLRGDDVVVIAGKILAKSQGRWHREGNEPDGFRTRTGIPAKLGLKEPAEPDSAAAQIRRGLAARFGGRPGVIITGSGGNGQCGVDTLRGAGKQSGTAEQRGVVDVALGSAGLDLVHRSGMAVADAIAALAGVVAMSQPDCPVVVVRGIPDVMTWEDQPER
ncbi:coenzyme F420-0:L-glutamate ligase [Trueperella bialowiezensis]|nr:coenzyme F420-0:L-glutamate ligase [Trueperella bialowiezensis]